jgi:hypothetical protein
MAFLMAPGLTSPRRAVGVFARVGDGFAAFGGSP